MKNRVVYFDYLRVFSMIAVVVLHVAAQNYGSLLGRSYTWNIFNIYNSLVRWGVPIFVMISGSLFLSRKIEIKELYKKNILKLSIIYIFWSIFYAVIMLLINNSTGLDMKTFLSLVVGKIVEGHYHMWFIPMIIGLYMCLPILKEIIKSSRIVTYFLSLSFLFGIWIPQLVNMSNDFIGGNFSDGINSLNRVITNDMGMNLVLGFTFYFVLGYLMNKIELKKKHRSIIYILGMLGFIFTILLNAIVAWKTNVPCSTYYNNFSINVFFEVLAIHTFFKYREYKNDKFNSIISILAKYSLGVYLIHPFVMAFFNKFGINTLFITPIVSVPFVSLITIIFSFLCSWIINKIPKIGKWIV